MNQTTPVHMYPDGQTLDGVWDMSGNVLEWTSDVHKDYMDAYYVKGGSAWWGADSAKASAAVRLYARNRSGNYGFRVVVVPISRSQ